MTLRRGLLTLAALIALAGPALADPPPLPPPPDHLFGDWKGLRPYFAQYGVEFTLDYTTETAGVVSGGLRRGATYAHQIGLTIDTDWNRLAGVEGLSTHFSIINRAGASVSPNFVGDTVLAGQEIYGAGFGQIVKLTWFYGEEKLLGDALDIRFGRFAPGNDYAASPLYCSFMTLTICGHPRALTANQGFEDWPMSEWGTEIKYHPSKDTYVAVGAFQSQPFPTAAEPYTQGGHSGWDWTFKGTTGASIPIELGYEPQLGPDLMPGHYKIGVNYDTSDYADNFADKTGTPVAISGLPGRMRHGRTQFWASMDQMVFQHGANRDDGLYVMAAYAHDDPATSLFRNFLWGGLIDRGFFDSRPEDQIGVAVTYYDVSPGLTQTELLQNGLGLALAGGAKGIQRDGMVFELNYDAKLYQGVQVQPELEYFHHPGAVAKGPDALLLGLKTYVNF